MATLPEILRKRRKELKLKPEEVAEKIGVSKRTYEYYEDGVDPTTPKAPVLKKIAEVLQFNVADIYDPASKLHQNGEENKDKSKTDNQEDKNPPTTSALISLADSNKVLAASNKIIAESNKGLSDSNKILAKTNARLANRVLGFADHYEESHEVDPAKFGGFQELLIAVALGKKFRSIQEVHAVLNKGVAASESSTYAKDIQKG